MGEPNCSETPMPIYEYVCQACGHETEILHGISEAPPKKCPACGKPKLSKMVSAAAFRLKGGGWYETDFKSGNKKNLVGDAEPTESKSESPASSKSEPKKTASAKPAANAAPKPAAKPLKKPVKAAPRKPAR